MMCYKDYYGKVVFDDENDLLHGEIAGIRDVVTFQAGSVEELRKASRDSVDDYLEFCRQRGESPEKPASGRFVLRIPPEMHRRVSALASAAGQSLNAWINARLREQLGSSRPTRAATMRRTAAKRRRLKKSAGRVAAICPLAAFDFVRSTGSMNYRGRRVTIMGLGHFGGGLAAARWLARQGATVTVTDLADESTLAAAVALLEDVPIAAMHFGGHREEDFRETDLVVVNPAVRPHNPFVEIARCCGARLSSEIELFLDACPAQLIGVTGSNGKSTTAAMIAAMLRAGGKQTWLGGNLGGSLLDRLPEMTSDDWVVLELSSFQLWHLSDTARLPQVAVVTGCSANHLDWHGSYELYVAAKQRLLTGQSDAGLAVLNPFAGELAAWSGLVRGRRLPVASLSAVPPLAVPGEHNRINAACAAAAVAGIGCAEGAMGEALQSFRGLPQRLEWFATVAGRRFYNDSSATTPESTIAALRSLREPVWLLAGGRNKGCDLAALGEDISRHALGAAFFGSAAEQLRDVVLRSAPRFSCTAIGTLDQALAWCWERSRPGDAILLSPACASTDQFLNFQQRGERFVQLVEKCVRTNAEE